MCMYFVGCRLMKNKLLTENVWNLFPYVFPTFGAQAITNEDGSNSGTKQKASHARSLSFFAHLFTFVCKKIQDSDNQKFTVLRTETFSHVISNSKSARTKFKLIGKFKMLRKLKQQKAFPARSLSFCCTFIRFCTQRYKKSNYKKFKDFRRNTSI